MSNVTILDVTQNLSDVLVSLMDIIWIISNLNKWLESKFDILSLVLESKIMIQCGTSTVLTSLQAIHARGKGARDNNC